MAVKTITVDMDAYRLLDAEKRSGESFSKVIKRTFGEGVPAEDLLKRLNSLATGEADLEAYESVIRSREEHLIAPVRLDVPGG